MRTVHLKTEIISEQCLFNTIKICLAVLLVSMTVILVRFTVTHVMEDCHSGEFMLKFCEAVSDEMIVGGACHWMCDTSAVPKRTFDLCPKSKHHVMEDSQMLRSSAGPVLAMNRSLMEEVVSGYTLHSTYQLQGETSKQFKDRMKQIFRGILNNFLNEGTHEAILNTIPPPGRSPVTSNYIQSTSHMLSDQRLVLQVLFYGSGERSHSPPGDGTETIAASDFLYTCAGVYQTTNLANHTTPLTEVLNKSSSRSWLFTTSIDIYHLYEVVLHLLDLEEATLEHPQEGQFYVCNLNTSQILLHNSCVKAMQSPFQKLGNACTMKVVDISKMLYSRDYVRRQLSAQQCKTNQDCRFHSCGGQCIAGRCDISHQTQLSGLLQICSILSSIENQLLEGANSTTTGHMYYVLDRCLDMSYSPPLPITESPHHMVAQYNLIFMELKMLIMDMMSAKHYELSREGEALQAKKERAKAQAKLPGGT